MAVGLAALLERSSQLYQLVRWAGAAYLLFLGISTIWSTIRRRDDPLPTPAADQTPVPVSRGAAFRHGFVSDVLNPKTGIFYLAIVPQLIPDSFPVLYGTLLFSSMDAITTALWFAVVSVFVARLASHLRNSRAVRYAERAAGTLLIGLGIRTALERG